MGELTRMREAVDAHDAEQQKACDQLRKDIEQERHEGRESMNKFRYEFDELVHKRVETVVEGMEQMEQAQRHKDAHQQRQIDTLAAEVDNIYANLGGVTQTWRSLKQHSQESKHVVQDISASQAVDNFVARDRKISQRAAQRRRSSLQEAIQDVWQKRDESHGHDLAEQVRSRLKGAAQSVCGQDWQRVLLQQDRDGSGQISLHEFRAMCRTTLRLQEPERNLQVVFGCLDAANSGEISLQELVAFISDPASRMRSRLRRAVQATGASLQKLVEEHGSEHDGQISFSEFRRLCHKKLKLPETDYHLAVVFRHVDAHHSGAVPVRELAAWVEGRRL